MKVIQLTDDLTLRENMPVLEIEEETGLALIKGRCLPESAGEMQLQLNENLNPLLEKGKLYFSFKLDFFNTASSKIIELFLNKMQASARNGNDMKVEWFFQEDDEDMEEAGAEFATLVDFPFELVQYEEDDAA